MLIGLGLVSLVYWRWTKSLGQGDLRFYGFVQFYPIIAIPAVCVLFPEYRYLSGRYIAIVAGCYALSKLLEHFDREVFDLLSHSVSGHTLKHLAAATAALVVVRIAAGPTGPHSADVNDHEYCGGNKRCSEEHPPVLRGTSAPGFTRENQLEVNARGGVDLRGTVPLPCYVRLPRRAPGARLRCARCRSAPGCARPAPRAGL